LAPAGPATSFAASLMHCFQYVSMPHANAERLVLALEITEALTVDRQQGSDEQDGEQQLGLHTSYLHRAADTGLRTLF